MNLTETPEWVAGIYQLEETDPVMGGPEGIDNEQAKQLANRTAWLKGQIEGLGEDKQPIDALLSALAALVTSADKVPYFTGADAVALAAFTAFGRSLVGGADAAAVRALLEAVSQDELADAVAALVDSAPAALNTLNEFAAALGDDANFAATTIAALALKAPLASPALTGAPTAPTAAQFDDSTKLATTAGVKRQGLQYSGVFPTSGALGGVVSHVGGIVYGHGATGASYSLPDAVANGIPIGGAIKLFNLSNQVMAIVRQGADVMQRPDGSAGVASFSLPVGTYVDAIHVGAGTWELQGTGVLAYSAQFGASAAASGYQKLPSGIIIQWGATPVGGGATTFPIAFPNSFLALSFAPSGNGLVYTTAANATGITTAAPGGNNASYIAIGW